MGDEGAGKLNIYKSAKFKMLKHKGTVEDKFKIFKELGYDGVEVETPCSEEMKNKYADAAEKTGLPIHGSVNSKHWSVRLSDKDPDVRQKAVKILKKCIQDTYDLGGSSVLLVPGRVNAEKGETHDQVWKRSIEGIKECLPLASKLGIHILIENVWNGFCTKPELLKKYVEEINSPWVKVYFDIGNVEKISPPAEWIRVLGAHIVKLDVKDWGQKNGFCKIGDGDVNWKDVRTALKEIGFTGWATAEVKGGGKERLSDISSRMNKCLGLE